MSDFQMIDLDKEDEIERITKEIAKADHNVKSHAELLQDEVKVKKKKKAKKKLNPVAIVLLFGFLAGISGTFFFWRLYENEKNKYEKAVEASATLTEVEHYFMDEAPSLDGEMKYQEGYEEGLLTGAQNQLTDVKNELRATIGAEGFIQALRNLYPECVIFYDTNGYQFVDIDESIGLHSFQNENFVKDDMGFIDYIENETVVSKRGIDVSKYNEVTDWEKVKASGIEFVFVRVGFRGYGSGEIILDDTFMDYVRGAKDAGLKVGAYFFTQAISVEEAKEEARFVLEQIEEAGVVLDYPIAYDIEKVNKSSARAENLPADERTTIVQAFCQEIEKAGYQPMIYGNIKSFLSMLEISRLKEYPKWYAFYDDFIYYPYELDCWQYSEKGKVDGIKGEVDINVLLEER